MFKSHFQNWYKGRRAPGAFLDVYTEKSPNIEIDFGRGVVAFGCRSQQRKADNEERLVRHYVFFLQLIFISAIKKKSNVSLRRKL